MHILQLYKGYRSAGWICNLLDPEDGVEPGGVGDPREVVSDPEAGYFGGRVEERSLVPLGEARLGRITLDEWLRHSRVA